MQRGIERQGEAQRGMWSGQSHIHMWWIKIRRVTLGVSDPGPKPDHPTKGSSDRKICPHIFWL